MKDYFKILGVNRDSSQAEIKEAYRRMALLYHPDRNQGDKLSEEKFKEIAEAYEYLNKVKPQNNTKEFAYDFKDFNDFKDSFNESFRHRKKSQGPKNKQHSTPPDPTHLNINLVEGITVKEICTGTAITVNYIRTKLEYIGTNGNRINYKKVEEEKELKIDLDFKKKKFRLEKDGELSYLIKFSIPKLGNEDCADFKNIMNEYEQIILKGDVNITVKITCTEEYRIDSNNIIQRIEVPLYKLLKDGEKIRIETLFDKKYDAEIAQPTLLSGLKFVIKDQGILGEEGLGNYIVKFDIITPNLTKLKKSERDQFLNLLKEI